VFKNEHSTWAHLHDADQKQKSKTQTHPSVADRDRDTLLHQGKTMSRKSGLYYVCLLLICVTTKGRLQYPVTDLSPSNPCHPWTVRVKREKNA